MTTRAIRTHSKKPILPCGSCGNPGGRILPGCSRPSRNDGTIYGFSTEICIGCLKKYAARAARSSQADEFKQLRIDRKAAKKATIKAKAPSPPVALVSAPTPVVEPTRVSASRIDRIRWDARHLSLVIQGRAS